MVLQIRPTKKLWSAAIAMMSLAILLVVTSCGGTDAATPVASSVETVEEETATGPTTVAPGSGNTAEQDASTSPSTVASGPANTESSYLLFNEKLVEGLTTETVDLNDVDAVFWHIFSRLPDEVTVYPSENYYYFIMYTDRRQLWGNIRLATGRRERGVLSFAYFEFRETPYVTEPRVSSSKFFTKADGLRIEALDPFTYKVSYNDKEVVFNLHKLSQEPPQLFTLDSDETSVMRTFDESGYQFFLVFNETRNYFNWVLNEEEPLSDVLMPLRDGLLVGRKSGFAFWVDRAHGDRKTLIAIRGASATRNDYYDGPFDQLADNYVEQTNISEYMQRAAPSLRGRIDKYGYFTDRDRPSRVSISPYYVYFSNDALNIYFDRITSAEDPYFLVSRKGILPTPTPNPPPTRTMR